MNNKFLPLYCCRLLCLICLSAYFSACTDDNNSDFGTPQTLLTIDPQVIPYFAPDHWVYATDDNGNVLDVKKTINNDQLILTSPKPVDKFNLTIVSGVVDLDDTTYLSIVTYADVARGSTFKVKYGTGFTMKNPGDVTFKLSGYDGPPNGILFTNRGYYTDYTETIGGGTFNANILMYGLPSDVLLTTYRNGVPIYANIKDVRGGDKVELDLDKNFTPFEHQRKLDFDGYYNSGSVAGAYLDNNGKLASVYFNLIESYRLNGTGNETNQPLIGYIGGFDIYRMNVVNLSNSGYVSYLKQGDIKNSFPSFAMPTFTFKLLSPELTHFSFDFSEDFSYYNTSFVYRADKAIMSWMIYGPRGKDVVIGDIPHEILAAYPMIRPEAFRYRESFLTKIISGDTYQQNILRVERDPSAAFEVYVFTPMN